MCNMGKRVKFTNQNWTYYRIRKLAQAADLYMNGSKINYDEYKELTTYNKKLARLANKHLRELKKAGKDYYAYDSAIAYTKRAYGTTRYKEKLESPDDMKRQILSMQRFLNYKTSTLAGHAEVEANRRMKFRTIFPSITEEVSDDELDNFLRFLGDAPMRSTIFESGEGGSGSLVDLIRGQYIGKSEEHKEEVRKMFERFRHTQSSLSFTGEMREYDLGYDELIEYLKTGQDPTGYYKKGEDEVTED